MTELAHHLVETWPEILGGFIAYNTHNVKHALYHAIAKHLQRSKHAR